MPGVTARVAIVVLTNQEATGAHHAIVNSVLDHYLGAPDTDWVAAYSARTRTAKAEAEDLWDRA